MQKIIDLYSFIIKKYKIESIFFLIALVVFIFSIIIYFYSSQESSEDISIDENAQTDKIFYNPQQKIKIDLSGAVQKPDVYEVTIGARIKDLLNLAQGLSADADREFFARNFNLARLLKDQEKIYIPSRYEVYSGIFKEPNRLVDLTQPQNVNYQIPLLTSSPASLDRININKSTSKELDTLPGIGASTADKIIKNRPYTSIDEILSKKIVKKNIYDNIKELIRVD